MPNEDLFTNADRIMAAMDFAGKVSAQEERHKKEMAELLLVLLGAVDSLQALEEHCRELESNGHTHVPARTVSVMIGQMLNSLSTFGVKPMNAVGRPLDLDMHEVVAVGKDSSVEDDIVLEEKTKGYMWNDQLLRRAKVVVPCPEERYEPTSTNLKERAKS